MEVIDILIFIAMCILSYLLGGVSIARLITKKEKSGAINAQGSGNPGTMNMLRTHGLTMGLFTLFCDALKGVIPALFSYFYFGYVADMTIAYIGIFVFGFCAVVGHIFPIYYKFKGGKGIATTFGVFMVADPISTLILFGILFIVLYFIKIGSVVSLLFITIDAILQFFKESMEANVIALIFMCLMVLLDIYAHRTNLARLLDNKENPASLQDGLKKDIEKIKSTKSKKIEKIEKKYQEQIEKKHAKVQKKLEKLQEEDKTETDEEQKTEEKEDK